MASVLLAAAIAGLFWITVLPPLQGPDEEDHFAYTQWIVERGEIPWYPGGANQPKGQEPVSREVATALRWGGFKPLQANLSARPLWTGVDEAIWAAQDRALPPGSRATGPPAATFRNPPLYYLYAAAPYAVAHGGSVFDRLYLMRLANLPLLLLAVWLTWVLAGVLGAGTIGRTAAAALVGLQPQMLNVTATVGPDLLLVVLWTAGICLAVRVARDAWSVRLALAALAVTVGCALTHPRGAALAAPLGVAIVVALTRRYRPTAMRGVAWTLAALGVVALVATVVLAGTGAGGSGGFASYAWQFYLPRLGFMSAPIGPPGYGFREAFVDRIWSGFADLEVTQPHWVTTLMLLLTLALIVAVVAYLATHRRWWPERWYVVVIPAVGALALLAVLHVTAYRAMLTTPDDPVITGRHVLPLLPIAACAFAMLLERLPRRGPRFALAALLPAIVLMQLAAAGELLARFYA